jgi:hypothetical protein
VRLEHLTSVNVVGIPRPATSALDGLTLGKCAAALGQWDVARDELTTAGEQCREIGASRFRVEAAASAATGRPAGLARLTGAGTDTLVRHLEPA